MKVIKFSGGWLLLLLLFFVYFQESGQQAQLVGGAENPAGKRTATQNPSLTPLPALLPSNTPTPTTTQLATPTGTMPVTAAVSATPPPPEPSETPTITATPVATESCRPASDSLNPPVAGWSRPAATNQPLFRGNANGPLIALTFDVEGTPSILKQLLNVLDRHGVKTTIFVLGSWAEQYPDSVADIARRGHELGNHTYSHSNIRELSAAQLQAELERTEEIILNLTGQTTQPWMRPPYGLYSQENVQAAYEAGWTTTIWTATAEDWLPAVTEESICNALARYAVPGAILLAHPSHPAVPAAVDRFITEMHARGYTFVPLSVMAP